MSFSARGLTLHQWTTRPSKPSTIRCPYCVEIDNFLAMSQQKGDDWFFCDHCGHLVLPGNPLFKCTCRNCVRIYRMDRKPKRTAIRSLELRVRHYLRRFR